MTTVMRRAHVLLARRSEGHRSRPATCSAPAGCVSSLHQRYRASLALHTSHRLLRVPPIRPLTLPGSHPNDDAASPIQTGKTHRLKTCATGRQRGAARAREPGSAASEARMAKRSRRAASGGPEPAASVRRRARAAPSRVAGTTPPYGLPGSTSRRQGSRAFARRCQGRDGSSRTPCTAAGRTAGGGRT